jgi:WD40 repeat protein
MLISSKKIKFSYADQINFPPSKANKNFDCEAFIHFKNNLYLFSKNHSRPYSGYTKLYKLPDVPGTHIATLIDSFRTGNTAPLSFITAATLSPDQKKLVLLSSDKIFVFSDFEGDNFFKGKRKKILLGSISQKEAAAFLDNETLVISDEKTMKLMGGQLYKIRLK